MSAVATGLPQRRSRWLAVCIYLLFLFATLPLVPWINQAAQSDPVAAHLVSYGACYLFVGLMVLALRLSPRPLGGLRVFFLAGATLVGAAILLWLNDPPIERIHLPEYGLLAALLLWALAGDLPFATAPWLAWLLAAAVGLADECLQLLFPTRIFDLRDVAANALSAALGVIVACCLAERDRGV